MGFLDTAPDNKLIPGKRFFERPLSNTTVQAGSFTAAYSEGGNYITIDEHLCKFQCKNAPDLLGICV